MIGAATGRTVPQPKVVSVSEAGNWTRVAGVKQVGVGEMLGVAVGKRKIAVFHLDDGSWHATDNVCTHAFALLTEGYLEGDAVECPLHAGRFDIRSGKGLCAPVDKDLATYRVRVEGADVLVAVPAA
jgi:nitrite reductase/ring-hydroxylating ferredoxin subunit